MLRMLPLEYLDELELDTDARPPLTFPLVAGPATLLDGLDLGLEML